MGEKTLYRTWKQKLGRESGFHTEIVARKIPAIHEENTMKTLQHY